MGLLGVVNLAALAMLAKVGFRLLKDYDEQRKTTANPKFDPEAWSDLDIDPSAWRD
jgi:AGCS family alanine or glycine:cation symporter